METEDLKFYYSLLKRRTKFRGKKKFNITIEDMLSQWEKQNGLCALTGLPLDLPAYSFYHELGKRHRRSSGNASIDRIDSSKHYEPDNIQWVHQKINFMKKDWDKSEFVDLCRSVAEFHKKTA